MFNKKSKKKKGYEDDPRQGSESPDDQQDEQGINEPLTKEPPPPEDPMRIAAENMRKNMIAGMETAPRQPSKKAPPPQQDEENGYEEKEQYEEEPSHQQQGGILMDDDLQGMTGEEILEQRQNEKEKKKKKILMAAAAVLILAIGVTIALVLPRKGPKQPVNLGSIPMPNAQQQTPQKAPAQQQPDVLVPAGLPQPSAPETDFRNGLDKTSQWWKQQVEQKDKMEKTLKERYDLLTKQYGKDKKKIGEELTKQLAQVYPGSVFNGKEGYIKLSDQYDLFFDDEVRVTKIVYKSPPYMRIYTFRSPTGATQNDYQIAIGKESITIDLDPNIPNNCKYKSIELPDMSQRITDYFAKHAKIPKPEGDPAIAVINRVYLKQIANTPNKKYDMDIFGGMILSDTKVREYIINYAETGYTP